MANGKANPTAPQNGGIQQFNGSGSKTIVNAVKQEVKGSTSGSTAGTGTSTTGSGSSHSSSSSGGLIGDLWMVGAVVVGICIILFIVRAVILQIKGIAEETWEHVTTPELDGIWIDDPEAPENFAKEFFEETGQENRYYADEFAKEFFQDSEHTPSTFAKEFFENDPPITTDGSEQFAEEFFVEESESEQMQIWRADLDKINSEMEKQD